MKLIFLDVDGVLNDHEPLTESQCGTIHKDRILLLNNLLRITGAKIILSSAWRYLVHRREMNLAGLNWLFRSHGLIKDSIVGITRPDEYIDENWTGGPWPITNERGKQIGDYPKTDKYVVVDDLDLGISAEGHPFVHVEHGLNPKYCQEILELL